jgi:hypothetical protein
MLNTWAEFLQNCPKLVIVRAREQWYELTWSESSPTVCSDLLGAALVFGFGVDTIMASFRGHSTSLVDTLK